MPDVPIPNWVPLSLQLLYSQVADQHGEEEAASQIRSRKRQMSPFELQRDADIKRRIKLGFKIIPARVLMAEKQRMRKGE
jgi:hypothetical protein